MPYKLTYIVGSLRPADLDVLASLARFMTIVATDDIAAGLAAATMALSQASASKNGSVSDAHILALAWKLDADLWSHDRDCAGTGWPSWSTANLRAACQL